MRYKIKEIFEATWIFSNHIKGGYFFVAMTRLSNFPSLTTHSEILISYVSAQVSVNSNWSSLRSSWDPHRTEPRYSGNIFSHHVKIFSILLLRAGAAGASAGVGRLHIRQLFLLPGRMRAPGLPSSPPPTVYYSVQISKISYEIKNNE